MNKQFYLQTMKSMIAIFCVGLFAISCTNRNEQSKIVEILIRPSSTDSTIENVDVPHLVMYDSLQKQPGKLCLFLPGTNGVPNRGPKDLFRVIINQGYRVINLSYINTPAVAQICKSKNLEDDCNCTEKFRTKRIYGTNTTPLISDMSQDAIVPRLVKLLEYLEKEDPQWGRYLKDGQPNWAQMTLTGQSQGGGMAAFIAKDYIVDRVVAFSGGWDYSAKGEIAHWYSKTSKTQPERWFGTYNIYEPAAEVLERTYQAMQIPDDQIYPLSLDVPKGKKAHTRGVRDTAYVELWNHLFDDGFIQE